MGGMIYQAVLYGIVVYVIDVVLEVLFATESMFPETFLPNAAMAALLSGVALRRFASAGSEVAGGEAGFDG